ncbi:hypothetical protein STRAU_2885 [Streptomyces aurantiacus JA 4570]|uniref:Uncharacterized protein n=1 Tax=Streptomyces aurantiacus JA 4570 TaxID=1286094 RepID=S3ZMU9_9ACTN|nr:hypothetical protein STRAU_2885 [Streptomyces aurantiacus JA 4570]
MPQRRPSCPTTLTTPQGFPGPAETDPEMSPRGCPGQAAPST